MLQLPDQLLRRRQTARQLYTHTHGMTLTHHYTDLRPGFVANSKYKIQALFKDFQGPKLHFSSTKSIDKKPYPRRRHSKFSLHTSACFKIVNKCKISKLARFKFKDFSRIFKYFQVPYLLQALSRALKFLFQIQAFSRISQARYEP